MLNLTFLPEAWEDYLYWQGQDKKTLKRINVLLKDIMRDYYHGLGKPEPLKGNLKPLFRAVTNLGTEYFESEVQEGSDLKYSVPKFVELALL